VFHVDGPLIAHPLELGEESLDSDTSLPERTLRDVWPRLPCTRLRSPTRALIVAGVRETTSPAGMLFRA